MGKIHVNLKERSYDIVMETGILSQCGDLTKSVVKGSRVAIVTDSNVNKLYGKTVVNCYRNAGFLAEILEIPAGESSKNPVQLAQLWEDMASMGMTRHDTVVALGGGVVGDLAGFVAATLYRGVAFVQIPTTLLAQVDSSVGGKVAVDLQAGKNLAGAFYQPKLVIIDPLVLDSLSDKVFADGMAEVIKYGCIWDETLFEKLEKLENRKGIAPEILDVVATCCDIKRIVVEEDELDFGLRMILNFGHTLAHVYEKAYHYETYTHGEAVAAGMVSACKLGVATGVTPADLIPRLEKILTSYGLPTAIPVTRQDYLDTLHLDKKADGKGIQFILLPQLGKAGAYPITVGDLLEKVEELSV
ncbi:MAG: 3-dehydroquinate synthase [Eubacteriales bacterium]